jgi:hypothetical protein
MQKKSDGNLMDTIESLFANAPALPVNIKEVLVKYAPILSLIFGILGILLGIGGISALTVTSPFAMMGGPNTASAYGVGFIAAVALIISSGLMLAAYSGLKAKKAGGWNMMFWSEVVSIASSLISLNLVGALISAVVGFYILFQIKSYYK